MRTLRKGESSFLTPCSLSLLPKCDVGNMTDGSGRTRHHMKLRAALCSLKLANARVFDKNIDAEYFELIAATLQASLSLFEFSEHR